MEIDQATAGDAEAVAAVFEAARADAMPWLPVLHSQAEDRRFFAGVIADSEVLVVRAADRAIAFIALADDLVEHLYVSPAAQRTGIGSALLDAAKLRRPAGLRLWTLQANHGARAFYARHGFVETERTDGSDNDERQPDVLLVWEP